MQIIIVAAYFQDIGVAIYRLIRWLSHLCCLHMINIQQCLHEKCELHPELFIPNESCLVTTRLCHFPFKTSLYNFFLYHCQFLYNFYNLYQYF